MADPSPDLFNRGHRVNWVRLRTLIILRWIAIAGQLATIGVGIHFFEISLNIGLAFLAIGAAVVVNLVAIFVYPENKRLSESEVAINLIFDVTQLTFMLYLTGGLNNPFALLILIPVTVSATALRVRTTVIVGAFSIAMISFVTKLHIPLTTTSGAVMQLPGHFVLGFWVAIVLGVVFLASFAQRVTSEVHAMTDALAATQMALAREQKLTDLGGVVAAAAHELGTPLATIKLVSSELMEELDDQRDLYDDARLIREQADRCRDILRSMGRAGKGDLHLKHGLIAAVVREAAEPHKGRGININYDIAPWDGADPRQPIIERRPEIVHGVRNLIQNAVDFAIEDVWIDIRWDADRISLRITDDGPGFPAHVLSRIGDPFVRSRRERAPDPPRPEYEGMGLGLFIAKTLLERSGGELSFANGRDPFDQTSVRQERSGALVDVTWPYRRVAVEAEETVGLGQNRPIEA
ncbi:MAG: ActS/PrrB/RegB family redox-sensitive histidine kinase [Pseudomonadota bacterium]